MAECIVLKGGGGISSDELSITKEYVLKDRTYVGADTNDEIGIGTMPNLTDESYITHVEGNPTKVIRGDAAFISKNTDGVTRAEIRYNGKSGYIAGNTLLGIEQEKMAAAGGLTADKMLSNKQAFGIAGSIPLQNADGSGTDRAWSQGYSNWAGTINLKVRSGHYLNGVNWIQQDIPEYQPWNIKKGVNIGGVVGTFEGYVPTATDLYLRGNNIAGVTTDFPSYIIFESNMIRLANNPNANHKLIIDNLNLTGYSKLNFEFTSSSSDARFLFYISAAGASSTSLAIKRQDSYWGVSGVASLDIALFDMSAKIWLSCFSNGNIYRIWLS